MRDNTEEELEHMNILHMIFGVRYTAGTFVLSSNELPPLRVPVVCTSLKNTGKGDRHN
jgi:hypothetical protein